MANPVTIDFEIKTSKFRRFIALVLIRVRCWIDEFVITTIKVNGRKTEPIKIKDLIKEL